MMESNDDIFDWVMTFEDECLKRVKEEVIKTAEYNYGERGRKIAEKYYKQIDGEEDYDIESIDENCNDCKERAKKLIENAEFAKKAIEILSDDKIGQIVNNIDIDLEDLKESLDFESDNAIENSLFEVNLEDKKKILIRILLEVCKKI